MPETKLSPGRPPLLDAKLAGEIAALLIAGHTTTDVAQIVGVDRRSIARWRARAWSDREADRQCVELERMLVRGQLAAAQIGQVRQATHLMPLDDLMSGVGPLDDEFGSMHPFLDPS